MDPRGANGNHGRRSPELRWHRRWLRRRGRHTEACRHDSSGSWPFYTAAPVRKSLTTVPDLRRTLSPLTATSKAADIRGWQLSHGPFVGRPGGRNTRNSPHDPRFLGHRLFVAALSIAVWRSTPVPRRDFLRAEGQRAARHRSAAVRSTTVRPSSSLPAEQCLQQRHPGDECSSSERSQLPGIDYGLGSYPDPHRQGSANPCLSAGHGSRMCSAGTGRAWPHSHHSAEVVRTAGPSSSVERQ